MSTTQTAISHPVIGETTPYLGGSFGMFWTGTMHGLAAVRGDRLDILAIAAWEPGQGDCGRFLEECMKEYQTVAVWEIHNRELVGMLHRRGFRHVREVVDADLVTGMRWDKPKASA